MNALTFLKSFFFDLKNSLTGITNFRYEDLKNENRRNIRLLRYDLASLAETNLKELLD